MLVSLQKLILLTQRKRWQNLIMFYRSFKIPYLKHYSVVFIHFSFPFFPCFSLHCFGVFFCTYIHTYLKAHLGSTSKATVSMKCIPEVGKCIFTKPANFVSVVYTLHGYFQLSGLRSKNQYEKDSIYNKQRLTFDLKAHLGMVNVFVCIRWLIIRIS